MLSGFLKSRCREIFDKETIEGLDTPLLPAMRVNTLKTTESALVQRLRKKGMKLEKIPWVRSGYFIRKAPFSPGATPEYLLGHYFLQDPSSQYACEVLDPKRGMKVLDMAAAPGGKTTHLAQLMGGTGSVVALEINRERMKSLAANIQRMGLSNVITTRMDALDAGELGMKFDRVLLDAPCTGTGTMYKNPEAARKTQKDVLACTALQKQLLEAGLGVLDKNGVMVYSTCSILPEENEDIVKFALERGFKLKSIEHGTDAFIKNAKRFYPHVHGTQGFFIAKIQR